MRVVRFSIPARGLGWTYVITIPLWALGWAIVIAALVTAATAAPRTVSSGLGAPPTTTLAGRTDQDVPGDPNPGIVVPINARPRGFSYANWGVQWWRWALSFPASSNPIFDPTGAFHQQGQPNGVFF